MRRFVKVFVLGAVLTVSASVFANDFASRKTLAYPFTVVYLSDLGAKTDKTMIKSMAIKVKVTALRKEIAADTILSRKLQARGIPIRRIIGRKTSSAGNITFYVR